MKNLIVAIALLTAVSNANASENTGVKKIIEMCRSFAEQGVELTQATWNEGSAKIIANSEKSIKNQDQLKIAKAIIAQAILLNVKIDNISYVKPAYMAACKSAVMAASLGAPVSVDEMTNAAYGMLITSEPEFEPKEPENAVQMMAAIKSGIAILK